MKFNILFALIFAGSFYNTAFGQTPFNEMRYVFPGQDISIPSYELATKSRTVFLKPIRRF